DEGRGTVGLILLGAALAFDLTGIYFGEDRTRAAMASTFAALSSLSTVGLVTGGLGLFIFALALTWHRSLSAAIAPRVAPPQLRGEYPSITVIRPVRGKDVDAAENFAAALDTGYPGQVETLFVFDDEHDPGLPIAQAAVKAHRVAGLPGTADVIVAGAPPAGMTGKLNAMVAGQRRARGELIAFGDSDTRPDHEVLRGVVDTLLASPSNGSAFAPVLVHQAPKAAGDVLYALMQNALYSPLAAFASGEKRELPFIMGQLMVFRREALDAIGGVQSVQGQLVDDMAIGKRVHEAGYKNVMSRKPLHIATGGMTLAQFLPVFRRWMSFSRNGLPVSFVWRQWLQGAEFFFALAAMVVAVVSGHAAAALLPAAAVAMLSASLFLLNRRYGGAEVPARFFWTPVAFFLIAPVILVQNMLKRKVDWRGRVYTLGASDALAAQPMATVPALADVIPMPSSMARPATTVAIQHHAA
ncbi:MAG TPA: glycosyltransferase, partial [Polyangia bacterium]|nr:glycosyltransferase [Polyangia bacterium]